jgi:hypothetical protein
MVSKSGNPATSNTRIVIAALVFGAVLTSAALSASALMDVWGETGANEAPNLGADKPIGRTTSYVDCTAGSGDDSRDEGLIGPQASSYRQKECEFPAPVPALSAPAALGTICETYAVSAGQENAPALEGSRHAAPPPAFALPSCPSSVPEVPALNLGDEIKGAYDTACQSAAPFVPQDLEPVAVPATIDSTSWSDVPKGC